MRDYTVSLDSTLLELVRCTRDSGFLTPLASADGSGQVAHCGTCGHDYPFTSGILRMLDSTELDEESQWEQSLRDQHATHDGLDLGWQHEPHQMMEVTPTLEAMGDLSRLNVLELGCGNGRYTVLLQPRCHKLVAVDFSAEALLRLRSRLGRTSNVLLVQADITQLTVAEGQFGAALSTLVSNLPTAGHRRAMYRVVASGLTPGGRFVFGTHHHGIRERYLGIERSGRYPEVDMYRYNMTLAECRSEPRHYFGRVSARPIQIYLPVMRRLRWPSAYLQSRMLERVPILNRFGALTVCVATEPHMRTSNSH